MRVMKSKSFYESFQENLRQEDALLESANQKPKRRLKENIEVLEPQYSGRNSFYGKAFVETDGNKKTLTSYKTKIMTLEDGKITMLCDEDALSQTTLRHIREFLKQNGIEPLPRKELVKLINDKNLKEGHTAFDDKYKVIINGEEIKPGYKIKDFRGDEHVFLGVTNPGTPFGGMNGKIRVASGDGEMEYYPSVFNAKLEKINDNLEEAFDLDTALADVTEWAESIYKSSEINSSTIESLLNSKEELKDKYTDNQKAKIVKWFEDEEEKYMPMQEQDQTVRVVTANNDREYTIVDITELNTVSDGDVQAPIDITGLLEKVNERLEESVGVDWGVINYQSTRHNKETNDSNALFELCTGGKTYLMSMLLEENGSLFKVNNTKGQTIYKRKTNGDMVGLVESYIKQFLPKNDEPEIIKHINADLHERYEFIKLQTDLLKDVPKEEKEAFTFYLQNQMYAFIAEVSDEIKANEPTDEDKLELPTFDKMIEEVFGKQWVKEQPKENKLELDGVETLKEGSIYDNIEVGNEVYWVGAGNEISATGKVIELPTEGRMTIKWDDGDVNTYDTNHPSIIRAELYDNSFNECDKLKEAAGEFDVDIEYLAASISDPQNENQYFDNEKEAIDYAIANGLDYVTKIDHIEDIDELVWERETPEYDDGDTNWAAEEEADATERMERRYGSMNESYCIVSYYKGFNDAGDKVFNGRSPKEVENKVKRFAEKDGIEIESITQASRDLTNSEYLNSLGRGVLRTDYNNNTFEEYKESDSLKEADESPKNGLGTGYATFARKAANIDEVENRSKTFTDGEASYLVCSQEKLSKEEFDDLQENLLVDNDYCKDFNPIDTENYTYNVIEFICPDYDYRLLVDPSGYNYCRYVAKVGRGE